ncbi:hypothetical protein Egran_02843 [Elaphomyces granulatus]|uniref:DNA polymerase n=1 Tax=Elaphomyces granulatus TaxID=519963 RepID=A0A232LZ49_9EURO|nr:hypothetical protein Egran_02843 [Elaphomyces granulatus]
MESFRVRLNCLDHYQGDSSEFDPPLSSEASRNYARPKVPIIRAFGATETGQKVCAHIHGAFPYLYVEYRGSLESDLVTSAIRDLRQSIDNALAASYRNESDGKTAFVAHVSLVKGIPFYGLHVGYRFYFKIYLRNPQNIIRLADLLRQGAVMKCPLQPYESHLQYIPQWMCDYNLYGCAYMECSKVKFRAPVPKYLELQNASHRWHDRSIPDRLISREIDLPKQSHCTLEVDICVQDIMNRLAIKERPLHDDFRERTNPLSPEEKLVPSMAYLWQDETRRRKNRLGIVNPRSSPFHASELVSMSANPRNQDKDGWIHEAELRQKMSEIVTTEKRKGDGREISFDNFVRKHPYQGNVKTSLESVEDLFPTKHESWNFGVDESQNKNQEADIPVDVSGVLSLEQDHGPGSSDDEFFEQSPPVCSQDGPQLSDLPSSAFQTDNGMSFNKSDNLDEMAPRPEKRMRIESATRPINRDFLPQNAPPSNQDMSFDMPISSQEKPFYPQKTLTRVSSQNQRLSFPVVKDPNNLSRPLSFSQKSSFSMSDSQPTTKMEELFVGEGEAPSSQIESSQFHSSYSKSTPHRRSSQVVTLTPRIFAAFDIPRNRKLLCYGLPCPTVSDILSTINDNGQPSVIYQKPYYGDESDVPDRQRQYAGREFRLDGNTLKFLPQFDATGRSSSMYGEGPSTSLANLATQKERDNVLRRTSRSRLWEFAAVPPSHSDVVKWMENGMLQSDLKPFCRKKVRRPNLLSQIEGPTQKDPHGPSQRRRPTSVVHQTQYMSVMSIEVHINTRDSLSPDPERDEVACIFWCFQSEDENLDVNGALESVHVGIVAQPGSPSMSKVMRSVCVDVEREPTELDLITRLVDIVRFHDPDILTGYEVHNSSWGYLIERARSRYEYDLCDELSRVKTQSHGRFGKENDRWGFNKSSSIRITGRHVINLWRAMRSELNLLQYTIENVVFHLLQRRIPHFSFEDLTAWYRSDKPRDLSKVIEYFISRAQIDLEILEANELISRTSEQARLLGIDFFSVISRGSQFKVESLMFRIAKPENFILVSPSSQQVGQQNALECLPLVMEPQSDFYTSPLVVLDFQSLYPSVMIAYNYCYSTFLGRVSKWRGRDKMGFTDYEREPRLLELLGDKVNVSPNGMMYTKPEIRKSLLAKMLSEILETRVMVKTGMKVDKDDTILQRLLNNRQLALKLIANVTYGYTSASFSGRMPCAEIADSIVQTGRETLEKAIALIHSVERWGAEVVYGDTDSLFIYLKGRSREEAFDIGEEIASAVTNKNPRPVKLKFEKVYHPCVLLAKKRYVGFKYEHRDQIEPEFDAKGIETVRRDGTPAEQKIEEKALKILFRTADLSQVKRYFQDQCSKIMRDKVSIQDFCFAKEVRLGTYSEGGSLPPGAQISTKKMLEDPRLEPQYGERVPYVVVTGAPGSRLIDRCVPPEHLLQDAHLDLDAEYYITKNIIPPLERIFNLVGANVRQWYDEMPRFQRARRVEGMAGKDGSTLIKKTLESYMKSSSCVVCKEKLKDTKLPICNSCLQHPHVSLYHLRSRLKTAEKRVDNLHTICRSCMGVPFGDDVRCDSKDCPVFYSRTRDMANWKHSRAVLGPAVKLLEERSGNSLDW